MQMNFKLADYTKALLAKTNAKPISKKRIEYYNSKKFYDAHPDLMPSDVYIYEGRFIKQKEWDKAIKGFERQADLEILIDNVKEYIMNIPNRIGKIFGKK